MKPITFRPLLKSTLWGGDKIIPFKHLNCVQENVGESWEISGLKGSESVVDGGPYDGLTLSELMTRLGARLLGEANYRRFADEFPLLIKFIDAREQLSIQVHPNDEVARRYGMQHGKTEMWYVMASDSDAKLRSGLKAHISPAEYERMVSDDSIVDAIAEYNVKEGDCFFLPAGRIHSIGAGCFLAEIQQTSDCTYRIYDFKRRDKNGNFRELHTKEAAECIDYDVLPSYRTEYTAEKDRGVSLVDCPYFTSSVYDLTEPMTIDYSDLDSFVVLMALKGSGTISDDEGSSMELRAGNTLLVPATTKSIYVEGEVKFLEVYIA